MSDQPRRSIVLRVIIAVSVVVVVGAIVFTIGTGQRFF